MYPKIQSRLGYQESDNFLPCQKATALGFPGGSVVKNSPADAGDLDLIPNLGRSHMLWNN